MNDPIINYPVTAMRVIPSPWPEESGGGFYIEATNEMNGVDVLPPWFATEDAATEAILDIAARQARDEFRKVKAFLAIILVAACVWMFLFSVSFAAPAGFTFTPADFLDLHGWNIGITIVVAIIMGVAIYAATEE